MEKLQIYRVLNCNQTLIKMFQQQKTFSVSLGFKLYEIMKQFNEVEDYVIKVMETTYQNINFLNMTNEQTVFYNTLLSSEIELEYEKLDDNFFKNNDRLMLTLEDMSNLSIILKQKDD